VSNIEPGEPIFDESLVELVGDVLFWGFVVVLAGAAAWILLRLGRDLRAVRLQQRSRPGTRWRWLREVIETLGRLLAATFSSLFARFRGHATAGTGHMADDHARGPATTRRSSVSTTSMVRIVDAYRNVVEDLATWVRPRGRSETVHEYERRAIESVPDVAGEATALSRVVEDARYGGTVGDAAADEAERLRDSVRVRLERRRADL
jgi:hypothetical protein